MRQSIVFVLALLFVPPILAAPTPRSEHAEITALLTRLETSGCDFNRNGVWYSATEAKAHLLRKLDADGSLQNSEQFIERIASKSSVSGRPYLVRCAMSAPTSSRA